MVINENVILLMAAVLLALFAVMQLPKLFSLMKGEPKGVAAPLSEPVKTVAVYQAEAPKRSAGRPKKTGRKSAVAKKAGRPRKKALSSRSVGRPRKKAG